MFEIKRKKIVQSTAKSVIIEPIKKKVHSYIPINKSVLNTGDKMNFNIYYNDKGEPTSLFLKSGAKVKKEQKHESRDLYISENDKSKYESFLEEHLTKVLKDNSLSIDEKTDLIYQSSSELTHSLFANPNSFENAQRSEKIVTPILHSIIHNQDTIASYIKIISYDYYTHTHSLNVSIYSLSLGAELNLKEYELTSLGRAALLHDLGKSEIKHEIINKKSKLTLDEFHNVMNHPLLGHDIAINIGINDKDLLDGIRHHHEKIDGSGYPDSLKDGEIRLFPRIIGICDIFDALTTRRSYKAAMQSYDALYLMKTEMHHKLDLKLLNTFVKMLHS